MIEILKYFISNGCAYGFLIGFIAFFIGNGLNISFKIFEI